MASVPVNGWGMQSPLITYYRVIAMAVSLVIFFLSFIQHSEMIRRKKAEEGRIETIADLQKALSEIKTLKGFLPICSHCKEIREDKGYWKQIESYIQDHSDAEFSHSICQECAEKFYPDMGLYDENET